MKKQKVAVSATFCNSSAIEFIFLVGLSGCVCKSTPFFAVALIHLGLALHPI